MIMDQIIMAIVPLLAAGLALQQLLELLDPILSKIIGERDKRLFTSLISLMAGLVFAFGSGIRVLGVFLSQEQIMAAGDGLDLVDAFITALIISAGTEGSNSILKFLGYSKESKKGDAAALNAWVSRDPDAVVAMSRMDRKKIKRY